MYYITSKKLNFLVAKLTAKIRFYQVVLMEDPTKRKLVAKVKELIDKRYKMLNCVRRSDYRKFEWILEQLNICYQPNAMYVQFCYIYFKKISLLKYSCYIRYS